MKDYIATPKPNNYQSLHTTVIPTGLVIPNDSSNVGKATKGKYSQALFPIEIQIKTGEMERLAQFGIAIDSWQCADEISRSKNDSVEEKLNNSEAISTSNNGGRLLTREKEDQIVFNGRLSMSPQKLDSYSMTRRINWLNSIRQARRISGNSIGKRICGLCY
jgi:ppGpp synthetase/RelA/SpoT-type nucleotidyltranferase